MNEQPAPKRKRKQSLKAFTVYLDQTIAEDAEKIRYLQKHAKRRRVSEAIRDALDTHIAFLAGKLSSPDKPASPMRPELSYHTVDDELPETAREASQTFLKPRRG